MKLRRRAAVLVFLNLLLAFAPTGGAQDGTGENRTESAAPRVALTPYRFGIRANFPQPTFPADNPLTEEGVELGRRLFYDPILSRNGAISCARCHHPESAFSDEGRRTSVGVDRQRGRRNSMPLFNLAWRRRFFWDGRAATLREQVLHPIRDPVEMDLDPDEAARRLADDPRYRDEFATVFQSSPTSDTLARALEQFLLVQISQDSKFDKSRRGEATLTAKEQRGADLFFTEFDPARGVFGADCFHCHGNALFTNERFADNGLDPRPGDTGVFEVTHKEKDRGLYKIPSLRNVAVTGPYMHDGRFASLADVIDHYDSGVHDTPNLDPSLAKHAGPLRLSSADKEALVAFLETLTDEEFLARAMDAAPPPPGRPRIDRGGPPREEGPACDGPGDRPPRPPRR